MILVANGVVLATQFYLKGEVYQCPNLTVAVSDVVQAFEIAGEVGNLYRDGKVSLGPEQMREKRNKLLAESDWTQVADAPVDKAAWATYRQALRDIPSSADFPWDTNWPDAP